MLHGSKPIPRSPLSGNKGNAGPCPRTQGVPCQVTRRPAPSQRLGQAGTHGAQGSAEAAHPNTSHSLATCVPHGRSLAQIRCSVNVCLTKCSENLPSTEVGSQSFHYALKREEDTKLSSSGEKSTSYLFFRGGPQD